MHEEVNGTNFTRLQSYLATSTSLYVIWVLNTTWNQRRKLEPTKFTVQFTILNNCAVEHGLKAWLCGKQALHLFSYFSLFLYKLGHCQYKTSHKMKWWILIASFVIIGKWSIDVTNKLRCLHLFVLKMTNISRFSFIYKKGGGVLISRNKFQKSIYGVQNKLHLIRSPSIYYATLLYWHIDIGHEEKLKGHSK